MCTLVLHQTPHRHQGTRKSLLFSPSYSLYSRDSLAGMGLSRDWGITPLRQRQAQAGSQLKQHRSPAKTAPDQRTSAGDHGLVISLPPLSPNLWTVPIPVIPPRWTGSRKRTRGRQCRMAGWDGLATVSFRTGCAYVGHFVLRHNLTPGATSKSVAYAMPTSSMETLISRLGVDNT